MSVDVDLTSAPSLLGSDMNSPAPVAQIRPTLRPWSLPPTFNLLVAAYGARWFYGHQLICFPDGAFGVGIRCRLSLEVPHDYGGTCGKRCSGLLMFGRDFRFDGFDCLDGARLMVLRGSLRGMLLAEQLVAPHIVKPNDFPDVLFQGFRC